MIILGIDPGSRATGIAVITGGDGAEAAVSYDVVRITTGLSHPMRLKRIYDCVTEVIDAAHPDECAVEMPVYGQNPQSMLKLGRAQAAAMLACMNREIPITQYTPKEVKKSVTGNGNASKEQVWYMVQAMLKLGEHKGFDAADALAVAVCHAHRRQSPHASSTKDWRSFVAANPGRARLQ